VDFQSWVSMTEKLDATLRTWLLLVEMVQPAAFNQRTMEHGGRPPFTVEAIGVPSIHTVLLYL